MNRIIFIVQILVFHMVSQSAVAWKGSAGLSSPYYHVYSIAYSPEEACSQYDYDDSPGSIKATYEPNEEDDNKYWIKASSTIFHAIGSCIRRYPDRDVWLGPVVQYFDVVCPHGPPGFYGGDGFSSLNEARSKFTCSLHNNQQCTYTGNPISFVSGSKYQKELDYEGGSAFPIGFYRFYNTMGPYGVDIVVNRNHLNLKSWRYSYSSYLVVDPSKPTAYMVTDEGDIVAFTQENNTWISTGGFVANLKKVGNGWQVTDSNGITHTFDEYGVLTARQDKVGRFQTIEHSDKKMTIVNWDSDKLEIHFENGRPSKLVDVDGNQYLYSYTGRWGSTDVFESVTYPDGSVRSYQYDFENSNHLLTGISVDEVAIASWKYDSKGRAVVSEQAGGVNRTRLNYKYINHSTDPRVKVTNPLGKKTTYHFSIIANSLKVTKIEGHASTNCAAANKAYTYYDNGFLKSKTDWSGNTTTYLRNSRGLETSRIEAAGTHEERTVTTEWHSDFPLPTQVIEPERITTFTYDASGRLLTKTIAPHTAP